MSTLGRPPVELPASLARAVRLLRRDAGAARINLVPSEARLSPLARLALQSDLYHRYFFNEHADPSFWEFRGGTETGFLEHELAIPALRRLSGATHVNIRPLSGLNAMLLVVSALGGQVGDTVVCVDPASGGHFATTSLIRRLGRRPVSVPLHAGAVDADMLAEALGGATVPLVYLDVQNTLAEIDVAGAADVIARCSPTTRLHVDTSHTLGLVLGHVHGNPLDTGADTFGGSTHKSFPGPQKGVVMTRDETIAAQLQQAQFDLISSHHFAETIALALAAAEFEVFGEAYARQVVRNARTFARALRDHGFEVSAHGPELTDTHQVWMRHGSLASVTRLADRLAAAGIAANVQTDLPGQRGPAFRLGVNEVTFEGGGVEAFEAVAVAFRQARDGSVRITAADVRATFGAPFHFPASAVERRSADA